MLYNLIQKRRGKETVVMTDQLSKVKDRKKTLSASQRKGIKGDKVEYFIQPTTEIAKFQKKPHDPHLSGDRQSPRLTKWKD